MYAVSYTRLSMVQPLFLHLLYLSTHWWKLPAPWLSEAGVPRPTEQRGLLQDETHNQVGSRVHQLPQFSLSLMSHFWRLCWKIWWCSSSFGAVWKADVVVVFVALLGTLGALPWLYWPQCQCPVKLWSWRNNSANTFLEFQTSEDHWTLAVVWDWGLKISSYIWERWQDGCTLGLSLICGMSVGRCSWVSAHFYNVSSSFKIPQTLLSPLYISLF